MRPRGLELKERSRVKSTAYGNRARKDGIEFYRDRHRRRMGNRWPLVPMVTFGQDSN